MSHRYRLYPNGLMAAGCLRHCADSHYVWDLALDQANCYRPGAGQLVRLPSAAPTGSVIGIDRDVNQGPSCGL
ncbi:MAG: hypothetical protein ACYCS7_10105 [Acidimicrobiales bacterium]